MRMNKPLSSGLLAAAALALVPMSASAWSPKLEVSDTTWVQLGYLHQFWYQSVDDGAASGDDPSNEFFTRRRHPLCRRGCEGGGVGHQRRRRPGDRRAHPCRRG